MAIAIDSSTPAIATNPSNGNPYTTLTSASFSPPANALLVLVWGNGLNEVIPSSFSDSLGTHLTYTSRVTKVSTGQDGTAIWTAQVGSSAPGPLTVTATFSSIPGTSATNEQMLGVVVVTGATGSIGGTQTAVSTTNATPSATISSLTGSNSLILGVIANGSNSTGPTVGSGQSDSFNGNTFAALSSAAACGSWAQYLTGINLAAGSSATINDTAPSIAYTLSMIEILGPSGGITVADSTTTTDRPTLVGGQESISRSDSTTTSDGPFVQIFSPSTLIGNTSIAAGATATASPGVIGAGRFQCGTSGLVSTINWYVTGLQGATGSIFLGVYADGTNGPGVLIGAGSTTANIGDSMPRTYQVSVLNATLVQGRFYWLAFLIPSGGGLTGVTYPNGTNSAPTSFSSTATNTTIVNTSWAAEGTSGFYSIYASGTPENLFAVADSVRTTDTPTVNPVAGFVQSNSNTSANSGVTSITCPFTGAVTAGDLIVATFSHQNFWLNYYPSDTLGTSYSMAVTRTDSLGGTNTSSAILWGVAPKSGPNTMTLNLDNPGTTNLTLAVHEYRGFNLCDVATSATGSSGTLSSGSATTNHANELIFGLMVGATGTLTAGSGFVQRQAVFHDMTEDEIVVAAGSYAATATAASQPWSALMATFCQSPNVINRVNGYPVATAAAPSGAVQSLAVTIANSGDLIVVAGRVFSTSFTLNSISDSNNLINWQATPVQAFTDSSDPASLAYIYLWYGVSTGSGTTTVNATWSGAVGQSVEMIIDELTASGLAAWTVDSSGQVSNTGNQTTWAGPTLTPSGTGLAEAYWGYLHAAGNPEGFGVAGTPSGFNYLSSPVFNLVYFDGAVVGGTPTQGQGPLSASDPYDAVAAVFAITQGSVQPSDIEYHYSGGATNANPDLSLGGAISSNLVQGGATDNVWDDVTAVESATGETTYACIYIKNNTGGGRTWESPRVWIDQQPTQGSVQIGLDPAGLNGTAETVANQSVAPASVVFVSPSTYGTGLPLGTGVGMPPGSFQAVWLKRVIPPGAQPSNGLDGISIRAEGETE